MHIEARLDIKAKTGCANMDVLPMLVMNCRVCTPLCLMRNQITNYSMVVATAYGNVSG